MPPELHVSALGPKAVKTSSQHRWLTSTQSKRTNAGEIGVSEQVFTESHDIRGAAQVFPGVQGVMCQGLLGADNTTYDQRPTLMAWNQMIDAYFRAGMPVIAIELVEVMISSSLYRLLVIVGDEHSSARLVNVHEGSVIQQTSKRQWFGSTGYWNSNTVLAKIHSHKVHCIQSALKPWHGAS